MDKNFVIASLVLAGAALLGHVPAEAAPAARPRAFAACAMCHKVQPDAHGLGPSLWGIAGRKAGSMPGFNYSPAMKKAPIKWTRANLVAFISAPRAKVPGNRMAYVGMKSPADAAAIADYLLSLK